MDGGAVERRLVCVGAAFQIRGCVRKVALRVFCAARGLVGAPRGFWRPPRQTGAASRERIQDNFGAEKLFVRPGLGGPLESEQCVRHTFCWAGLRTPRLLKS